MKVFVNAYLENNLGDDLFFDILKNRYKGNKFYIMSSSMKKEEDVVIYKNKFINRIIRRFELKKFLTSKCDVIQIHILIMHINFLKVLKMFALGTNIRMTYFPTFQL